MNKMAAKNIKQISKSSERELSPSNEAPKSEEKELAPTQSVKVLLERHSKGKNYIFFIEV